MIIDAIMFSGELDVLDVRLHELDLVVDRFVIVEAAEYHGSDRKKQATLARNWNRFEAFHPKIQYAVLSELDPPHRGPSDSWPRENFHRNALKQVVLNVIESHDDIVMISDCDEIPRAQVVRTYQPCALGAFSQDFFYYDVNNYLGTWNGTVIGTARMLAQSSPQEWRNRRDSLSCVQNGGWHFSYFGGYDRILSKLQNFAHACEDSSKLVLCRSREDLIRGILAGEDLYQRPGQGRKERRNDDDTRLPAWLREHIGEFRQFTEDGLREMLS